MTRETFMTIKCFCITNKLNLLIKISQGKIVRNLYMEITSKYCFILFLFIFLFLFYFISFECLEHFGKEQWRDFKENIVFKDQKITFICLLNYMCDDIQNKN